VEIKELPKPGNKWKEKQKEPPLHLEELKGTPWTIKQNHGLTKEIKNSIKCLKIE